MINRVESLRPDQAAEIRDLMSGEEQRSRRRPLDEVNRLALASAHEARDGAEHWLLTDAAGLAGYAIVSADAVAELSARDTSAAVELLKAVRDAHPGGTLWAHGDASAARAAAMELRLPRERELALLTRALTTAMPTRPVPAGVRLLSFEPLRDAADWLALNRVAFADLPDQASWTRADLDLRLSTEWFDAADFLIARSDDGRLAGFHWTKIDPGAAANGEVSGEVFVIAVAPQWRGTGLAAALLDQGLSHLAGKGMRQVHLFVDADNTRAIALYEKAGFQRTDGDAQYRL